MFGTIRKHQTWLWAIIITFTIISFVVFFSPNSQFNTGSGEAQLGSIFGKKITEENYLKAQKETLLQYFFMSGGRFPEQDSRQSGYDAERETYQWLLLLRKADQLGVHISDEMVAQVARNMLSQFHNAGITSPQEFQRQVLAPRGLNLGDFQRFVRHYLGIQELVNTFGASGKLVTPEEARRLWVRENQELAARAVFISNSNFLAGINPNPEMVSQYYSNRMAQYRLPERAQVNYVHFNVTNHFEAAEAELSKTNLSEIVDLNFERLGTNYTRVANTPEEAKKRIRHELIRSRAMIDTRRQANAFATTLFEQAQKPEALQELAKQHNLTVQTTKPFGRGETPEGLEAGPNFAKVAFSLSPTNEVFGGPVVGEDGVYVLAFARRLPSELQPLDTVRNQVIADMKEEQAASMARQAGIAAHSKLTNAIAQGKDFAAAAKEANLNVVSLPPFSLSTRTLPELGKYGLSINELKQIVFALQPGEVSSFHPAAEGGVIIQLQEKLPVNETKLASEMSNFINSIRQNRQTEAFNDWFRREATVGLRDTPLGQPRPTPTMGGEPAPAKS